MLDIRSVSGLITSNTLQTVAKTASTAAENTSTKELASAAINSEGATLSMLARQLSESAVRAEARDTSLSLKELGAFGKTVIDKLLGDYYYHNKAVHDAEVPDTDDPALLERAKRATLYSIGTGCNPFAGLPQEQLRLIIYDESGNYTINERKAAYLENYDQEEVWNRAMAKRYVDEYNETGKSTETLIMILAHYNELPPIEKAQYPANYAANLTSGDSSAMAILNSLKTG